jgi:hypothetical protein
MSFFVSKTNGRLVFENLGGYETRNPSTFWCIQQADEKYKWKDFGKIKICTSDFEKNINDYTYSKNNTVNRVVPDFNFHSWPQVGIHDYDQCIHEISQSGLTLFEINKVGWIGNVNTNVYRKKLLAIGNAYENLFDIFDMTWRPANLGNVQLNSSRYLSMPDLVKRYSMLIDIEGFGYSGRLKYLLWSHRPVLLVDRPHKEFFFEFLKEWEHYIPVKRDLSDLLEKTKWCLDHYEESRAIAENAFQFSKIHLTRDACFDKWNEIVATL